MLILRYCNDEAWGGTDGIVRTHHSSVILSVFISLTCYKRQKKYFPHLNVKENKQKVIAAVTVKIQTLLNLFLLPQVFLKSF